MQNVEDVLHQDMKFINRLVYTVNQNVKGFYRIQLSREGHRLATYFLCSPHTELLHFLHYMAFGISRGYATLS
jgi:hypothetical protein